MPPITRAGVHTCWRASQMRNMHKHSSPWHPVPCQLPPQDQGIGTNREQPRHRRLHHRITVNP